MVSLRATITDATPRICRNGESCQATAWALRRNCALRPSARPMIERVRCAMVHTSSIAGSIALACPGVYSVSEARVLMLLGSLQCSGSRTACAAR